jgi:hypothetical protein
MARTIALCQNCGDPREIVSHGLCSKCLMRCRREQELRDGPWWVGPDRTQGKWQRDLNCWRLNCARMLKLLDESPISNLVAPAAEYETVKDLLVRWSQRINERQRTEKLTVNSKSELTVNKDDETADSETLKCN